MKTTALIIYSLLVSFIPEKLFSQGDEISDSISIKVPPLELLISSAYERSPLIKNYDHKREQLEQEIRLAKKRWLDYFYIEATSSYGLNDQVVVNQTTASLPVTGAITKNEQLRYYAGVSVKLPLTALFARNNEINKARTNMDINEQERVAIQKELKKQIIENYYDLKYKEESLKTFYEIYQTLRISYLKAEKDVLNGRMQLTDFALLSSTTGKAKDDYIKARNGFYAQFYILQEITGVIFQTN